MSKKTKQPTEVIIAYKGFDKNLQCRGFQYEIGKTYEHKGPVVACESGFHACEHPLDVLVYYPAAGSRFALVEQGGTISKRGGDTKSASSAITVKAELSIAGLVSAAVEYVQTRCKPIDPESPASATGYSGAASATGDRGAASATGDSGAASATGSRGAASATGQHSIAAGFGYACKAMASETGAIVLVNRALDGSIRHVRASKVGDNGIKPNAWYELDDAGNFVECAE